MIWFLSACERARYHDSFLSAYERAYYININGYDNSWSFN